MQYVSPVNDGIIASGGAGADQAERTIMVTGVARSGTTMVATVLREAGIFLGDFVHEPVLEDSQMLAAMRSSDDRVLAHLIAQRNVRFPVWGFKIPDLHILLRQEQISWFRAPRLIVIFRDPVAVAVRTTLSERFDQAVSIAASAGAVAAMAQFAEVAGCPLMLMSYEKSLAFPEQTLASLARFCGFPLNDDTRPGLLRAIQPNSPSYLQAANRLFSGCIDRVIAGHLVGWCFEHGKLRPLMVELFADGVLLGEFVANRFRDDLVANKMGNGQHGFAIDLSRLDLQDDAMIRIKVKGRSFELENSNRPLRDYRAGSPGREAAVQA